MSKIIYHKNCIQHESVGKAKRMLKKIAKQFGGFEGQFYCNIKLTGVNEIDNREVELYIERYFMKLKKEIDQQFLRNKFFVDGEENEDYEKGYYLQPISKKFEIIKALNEVGFFIRNNYPVLEVKRYEYLLTANSSEGKLDETILHFRNNPVFGFCQEFFVVFKNGKSKSLCFMTISSYDFENAKSILCEFFKN